MTETTLSTRCPQCKTRFRVTSEQLALRQGVVRCGACLHVFDGRKQFEADKPIVANVAATVAAPKESGDTAASLVVSHADKNPAVFTPMDFTAEHAGSAPDSTLAADGAGMQQELDDLSKALTDLQNNPWPAPLETDTGRLDWDDGEPGFIQNARKKQRVARAWKVVLGLGIPLLLVALAAQLTYQFRSEISARMPQAAPALKTACAQLACTIDLLANIDALSLSSSQLHAVPEAPGQFELVALILNQSATVQAWPALELLLKDEQGRAQVRKVLLPGEFLPQLEQAGGIDARSEREVRIHFLLTNAQAADFQLTLFYP